MQCKAHGAQNPAQYIVLRRWVQHRTTQQFIRALCFHYA